MLAILKRIKKSPIAKSLLFFEAEPARIEWLKRVHDANYMKAILSLEIKEAVVLDWEDTVATKASPQAALHAAGAGDREYLVAFQNRILPALDKFEPEFILISDGFDAHGDDPLSGMTLTTSAYRTMTALLKASAEKHCQGRIVSLLKGGYDFQALAESVEEHVTALTS
jgi:acetoin utilization deacetylase AcuC-like enzyme